MKTLLLKALLFFSLLTAVALSSCKKDGEIVLIEATVINAGAVASDGCGWVIRINDVNYSPVNLDDKFKESGLEVKINYDKLSSKFTCGWGQKIDEIKLLEINRR